MKFMLRYKHDAPIQPRPHEPTVVQFSTYGEAVDHPDIQPNRDVLEIVRRCCTFCTAGKAHPATEEHSMYELVGNEYACGSCGHRIPLEEVTPA